MSWPRRSRRAERATRTAAGCAPLTGDGDVAVLFADWRGRGLPLARALYGTFPVFRREFDTAGRALQALLPLPLAAVVFAPRGGADTWLLHTPQYGRPALFAYQLALFRLWREWGLPVGAVTGDGTGTVTAAHAAGVLDLGTAARHVVRAAPAEAAAGRGCGPPGLPTLLRCGPTAAGAAGVGQVPELLRAFGELQVHGPRLDWEAMWRGAAARGPDRVSGPDAGHENRSGADSGALETTGANPRAPLP
ncbi:hypothetical protein OHB54_45905 [Streptomyces sp. NBC_01007]|nr:hypothetical protein OHB54_00335 [Streptomyces sp. NBC_01007]WRZ95694.1 hypothetical protein OHB54_45905 [Streptomyces sp. NBC_01007]